MRPYLRVANVFEDRIDTQDVKEMHFELAEFERYRLRDGDVLLNEGQSPELLGRPAIYRGDPDNCAFTNSLIRFQAGSTVDPRWALAVFRHHMHSGRFAKESRITTNIAHLSIGRLRGVEFPVPPLPDQRRIVYVLEDHLSRLDAAATDLESATRRLRSLIAALLAQETRKFNEVPLASLATHSSYGTSTKCVPAGLGPAVVRIPNLVAGRVDMSDEKRVADAKVDVSSFLLQEGDLLVVRTNGSRDLIGRSAVVHAGVEAAFASYLIRFKLDASRVSPEWVHMVLSSPSVRNRLEAVAASSAGQYNLSLGKLGPLQIPLPAIEHQHKILAVLNDHLATTKRMQQDIVAALDRATRLRQSLLSAAFSGRLTSRISDDELEELASAR